MISRYHGHDVDLNGLRQRFSLSLAGASLRSLMGIADQLGFSTRALRVELSALRQGQPAGHPALGPQPFRRAEVDRPQDRGRSRSGHRRADAEPRGVLQALHRRRARARAGRRLRADHGEAPMKLSILWSRMRGLPGALVPGPRSVGRPCRSRPSPRRSRCSSSSTRRWPSRPRPAARDRAGVRRARHHPGGDRGVARLGAAGVRPPPELPDHRQSGAPPAAAAERLFREAPRRRHHLAARLGQADPGRPSRQGVVSTVIDGADGLHRGRHPVLLFDDAGADRHRRRSPQPGHLRSPCSRAEAAHGGRDPRRGQGADAPDGDRAGGDHAQADGPRGRARGRLAQPACGDDQRQHLGRRFEISQTFAAEP